MTEVQAKKEFLKLLDYMEENFPNAPIMGWSMGNEVVIWAKN